MEFQIEKAVFEKALGLAQGVVEKRNTLPILANVLIKAEGDSIAVVATDLDVGIRRTCPATVKSPGEATLNARKLYEIVRGSPGDTVRVRRIEKSGSLEVSSGKARFRLVGLDPKEFPKLPGLSSAAAEGAAEIRVAAGELGQMVERTVFAVSSDETRLNLSGVYAEPREKSLRLVATDGHRLAMLDRQVEGRMPAKGVILPRKGLAEVRKVLDGAAGDGEIVKLTIDGTMARVACGASELFMSLVEGEFPDYNQVLPKEEKIKIELSRDEVLSALRRVSILSTERSRGVKLAFRAHALEIQTSHPDLGDASEELEVRYEGEDVAVGFNARYLIEALSVLPDGDTIELSIVDAMSPGVVRSASDPDFVYVVMPMRL